MASDRRKTPPPPPEDCATAWFAVLERARLDGDARLAQQAESELLRLGVNVRFDVLVSESPAEGES